MKRFNIFFLILFLSACRMGKDYEQPALQLPTTFSDSTFADTTSVADISWKQFFKDTSLQALLNKGIQHNYDLQIAFKRVEIAEREWKRSKMQQLPSAQLQVSAAYNHPSDNSLNGLSTNSFLGKSHIENYQTTATLSWEADIWGKISRQQEANRALYLQGQEAAKAVQTRLVADIAEGYYNLLMLDEQMEIARKNLLVNEDFLQASRQLKDAGMVTGLAVQQAIAQKDATALLIPALEEEIILQENAIRVLTGDLPASISRKAELKDQMVNDSLSTGLPAAMVSRRPDVRASEMGLVAANARVGVTQAAFYPALNITAGAGLETFTASNWFNIPGSLFGLAAGSLTQPLFNRRNIRTNYEVAKLERETAVLQFRQSVLGAIGEVSNALASNDKLKQQENIAKSQTDNLLLAENNARQLFRSDLATYLEVLVTQGRTLDAALNLASIQRSRLHVRVELYRALGGGWQ